MKIIKIIIHTYVLMLKKAFFLFFIKNIFILTIKKGKLTNFFFFVTSIYMK